MASESKKAAVAVCSAAAMLLVGCGAAKLEPIGYDRFAEELRSGGYCTSDGLTSDSEDGTSAIVLTDNGWLAGFYECADNEVAAAEFDYECEQAGIDTYKEGRNYYMADKTSDEEYLLYVKVENTCLFMRGLPEDEAEMKAFAEALGYSDEQNDDK